MPVCKFFMQGNCKYGDRCYNHHPRHSGQSHEWSDRYDSRSGSSNREGSRHKQNYDKKYQSPMSHGNNRWYENDNQDYRDPSHNKQGHHRSQQHSNSFDYQHGYHRGSMAKHTSHSSSDRYHWSKDKLTVGENRFSHLAQSEDTQDSEAIINAVKDDIKTWAGSTMWPFSCYSHSQDSPCIDGLPDISPEEMRVIYRLHPQQYQNILSEIEANFCKRKDELFEMNDNTREDILAQIRSKCDANPSENLKASFLYGPAYNFVNSRISTTSGDTKSIDQFSRPIPVNPAFSSPAVKPFDRDSKHLPGTHPNANIEVTTPTTRTLSVFGSSSATSNKKFSGTFEVYTPDDKLSDTERTSFEADKFVLGRIPTRPPPIHYCR